MFLSMVIGFLSIGTDPVPGQELGLFRLRGLGGSMRFRIQKERRVAPEISNERTLNAILVLRNTGFVINPEILNFKWAGDLGLFHEQFTADNLERNSKGRFLGHNLTALFFQSSPNSLSFFWNRSTNFINLDETGSTFHKINNLQATLEMRELKLPSRLMARSRDTEENWERGGFKANQNQRRRSLHYDGEKVEDDRNFELTYDWIDVKDRIRKSASYYSHMGNVRYRKAFGEELANKWDSNVRVFKRKGLRNLLNIRSRQSLEIQHKPSLTSRYRHSLSFTNSDNGSIFQNTGSASLSHRLYASLNTNASLGGTYSLLQTGRSYTYSLSGGVTYTKRIPLSGRLQILYTRGFSINDLNLDPTEQVIVNERHFLLGSLPVLLNERNIIVSTIIIFNEDGDFVFEEGEDKDYTLRIIGDRIEIHRNPFGRMLESSVILVDYHFQTLPSMRYSTNTEIFSAGVNFGWISLNYLVNRHDQNLISGDEESLPHLQDLFTKALQLSSTLRGERAGMSLYAEKKFYNSTSISFDAIDLRYAFFIMPFSRFTITNNLSYSFLSHNLESLDIKSYSLRSELRWRPSYYFTLHGFGKYDIREETRRAIEKNFEYGVSLERLWRVFRVQFKFDKRRWDFGERHFNERRVMVEVERIF